MLHSTWKLFVPSLALAAALLCASVAFSQDVELRFLDRSPSYPVSPQPMQARPIDAERMGDRFPSAGFSSQVSTANYVTMPVTSPAMGEAFPHGASNYATRDIPIPAVNLPPTANRPLPVAELAVPGTHALHNPLQMIPVSSNFNPAMQGSMRPELPSPIPDARMGAVMPVNLDTLQPPGIERPRQLDTTDWAAEMRRRMDRMERDKLRGKKTEEEDGSKRPLVRVGGRIFADYAHFDQSNNHKSIYEDFENGAEFRRARIVLRGEAFYVVDYKLELDFANTANVVTDVDFGGGGLAVVETPIAAVSFKDAFIAIKELPLLGHVKLGHFKEPFGLEFLTSSKYITFMERSLGGDAFIPGRSMGIMAYDWSDSERLTWAIGAFRTEMPSDPPFRKDDSGGTSVTMRMSGLPWYDEATEGRGLFHVGMAYSFRQVDNDLARFRSRPEANLAPAIVDSDDITNAENYNLLGAEAAMVYGPFSWQSEAYGAYVHRIGMPQINYRGFYTQFSYFLTGEHRPYNRESGDFGRVKPFENFFRVRDEDGCVQTGKGAWEIAYRYSYIDLNNADVLGGRAGNHTLGLNWYLNPYTRLMWNFVQSHSNAPGEDTRGDLNVFEMRAQIDF